MSLLMQALKKAEQSRAAQSGVPVGARREPEMAESGLSLSTEPRPESSAPAPAGDSAAGAQSSAALFNPPSARKVEPLTEFPALELSLEEIPPPAQGSAPQAGGTASATSTSPASADVMTELSLLDVVEAPAVAVPEFDATLEPLLELHAPPPAASPRLEQAAAQSPAEDVDLQSLRVSMQSLEEELGLEPAAKASASNSAEKIEDMPGAQQSSLNLDQADLGLPPSGWRDAAATAPPSASPSAPPSASGSAPTPRDDSHYSQFQAKHRTDPEHEAKQAAAQKSARAVFGASASPAGKAALKQKFKRWLLPGALVLTCAVLGGAYLFLQTMNSPSLVNTAALRVPPGPNPGAGTGTNPGSNPAPANAVPVTVAPGAGVSAQPAQPQGAAPSTAPVSNINPTLNPAPATPSAGTAQTTPGANNVAPAPAPTSVATAVNTANPGQSANGASPTPSPASGTAQNSGLKPTPALAAKNPAESAEAAANRAALPLSGRKSAKAAPQAERAEGGIQLSKSTSAQQIHPGVQAAYALYQQGDDEAALQAYRRVLQQEPNNRDALLGSAACAARMNRAQEASTLYLRLLELDPNDPDAAAALIGLQQHDAQQSEVRLKKILLQHPQAASLHFTLGNVYARQERWADAQQSFFRAYTLTPNNPDYVFNLAVSLDRLHQEKLALEYYQRAQMMAQQMTGTAVSFSTAVVQQRIRQLSTPDK